MPAGFSPDDRQNRQSPLGLRPAVDELDLYDYESADIPENDSPGGFRLVYLIYVLAVLVAFAGVIYFAYAQGVRQGTGIAPPVIRADRDGVKEIPPEDSGDSQYIPYQDKLIYERIDGGQRTTIETLMPRAEQPVPVPQGNGAAAAGGVFELLPRIEDREVLMTGRERTGVAALPVPQPQPQSQPGSEIAETADRSASGGMVGRLIDTFLPFGEGDDLTLKPRQKYSDQVSDQASDAVVLRGPVIDIVPPGRPDNVAARGVKPEASESAPPMEPATASAAMGDFVIQLSAMRSQVDAEREQAKFQQRYGDLLAGVTPLIQRADLGDKGIYYRVRFAGLATRANAVSLCVKLKAAGVSDCIARKQ